MQNSKPEKIVGKKFVRGKPYFKVKWEGSSKDKSSWETPAKLKQFKSMVNRYEVKNWGSPLDEKYFDPRLYQLSVKTKSHDKKKAKKKKTMEKRKIQQQNSESEESEANQNNSEEQHRQPEQGQAEKQEVQNSERGKKSQIKDLPVEIIDLEDHSTNEPLTNIPQVNPNQIGNKEDKSEPVTNKNNKQALAAKNYNQTKETNEQKTETKRLEDRNQREAKPQFKKDLGLTLIDVGQDLKTDKVGNPSKRLTFSNAIYLEIEPVKRINRIAHIYHLEKVNLGNHLYLVQFNDNEMRKMTTKDLLEAYPDTFVNYLQGKYRAKCAA